MAVELVPIPTGRTDEAWPLWWPFLKAIAERNGDSPTHLVSDVRCGMKQMHLLYDEDIDASVGLVGTEILTSPDGRKTCHIIWTTGSKRQNWQHLLTDLEAWARDHVGCTEMKATARMGWKSHLKAQGYRIRHVVGTKDL